MKLIAQVKLRPTAEQATALKATLEAANTAANYISDYAWQERAFRQYDLHRALYYTIRERFGLTAQIVVRVLAKVADAYKLDRRSRRTFRPMGSIAYDSRILRWYVTEYAVSIWTVAGRQRIPFVAGERQVALLAGLRGEADFVLRDGEFYLHQVCEVEEPPTGDVTEFLGVDLGVTNIAVDSDGTVHSASHVKSVRYRQRRLRTRLQEKGTRSCKRRLGRLAGKERRFASHTNHCIAKAIVAKAEGSGRGIALEDLTHIRARVTAHRSQRATLHSWAFAQLRGFVEYKARLAGVPVVVVDARNTSRTCPACGCVDKRNRPAQATFSCVACGFSGLADHVAARNVSGRATVNWPNVSTTVSP
jgi:IS605 OrfB family transposase